MRSFIFVTPDRECGGFGERAREDTAARHGAGGGGSLLLFVEVILFHRYGYDSKFRPPPTNDADEELT